MTTIDASIPLGVRPVQIESPLNQLAQMAQLQGVQSQNALMQMKMEEARRGIEDQNALRAGLSAPGADPYKVLLGQGRVKEATEYQKGQRESDKARVDLVGAKLTQSKQFLDSVSTPEQYIQWHQANHADPILGPELASRGVTPEKAMASIQEALAKPGGFQELLAKSRLGLDKFMELNKPTYQKQSSGQVEQTVAYPGLGGPGTVVSEVQRVADPNAVLADQRARQTLEETKRHHGVIEQQGALTGDLDANAERTAQGIASGQLPAPTGMALLNPKNQRILGRVMEINPQYDASTTAAKQKAARDFTTGPLGNSMRSFQVAGQHLDQLNELVDALENRNLQIVNKIGNAYASQTGNPAPTNFEAAKDVVSKEVVKAIVAGGGGVTERQELSHLMSNAKSPAQLKGVIQQYRNLMAAQHDALLTQRRAAGLPDTTLPKYNEPGAGGTAGTAGWTVIDVQPAKK